MDGTQLQGIVVRAHQSHYVVETDAGEELLCSISSKLRKELEYPEADPASRRRRVQDVRDIWATSAVVVGDRVIVERGSRRSMIREILPRRSTISRESPGKRFREQVIAANVDQVLAVMSTYEPPFDAGLLDRILCGAEFQGLDACICLNKIDLGAPREVEEMLAAYERIGYRVVRTSAATGDGLPDLAAALSRAGAAGARTSVAMGLSGGGKTSLINALAPGLSLRVQPVSTRTGLGRHTTTSVSLVRLPSGDHFVDVPGLRYLSLWSAGPEDIPELFPEFRAYLGRCRFASCTHSEEPGCAIKAAVAAGQIAPHRHANYVRLWREGRQKALQELERRRPRLPG